MAEANWNNDKQLSDKMKNDFDKFYLSETFKEKYIKPLYKINKNIFVTEISRSENLKLQIGVQCDAVLKLSNGNRILIDDKTRRWHYRNFDDWCIEVVSNSTKKTDGWGYKEGIVICFGQINEEETGLVGEPWCFKISQNFINEIVRDPIYRTVPVKNPYYWTINKLVPKKVLEAYYP